MGKKGFVRNNVNQFAVIYRFLDLIIIQVSLLAAAALCGVTVTLHYYLISLVACLTFLFSAEMLWLYRSWRAGSKKEILFVASMSHVLMMAFVIGWMFISKSSEDYSRAVISLWFSTSWALSCTWRIVMRYLLFILRRNGRNTRTVGIIGANDTTLALVKEISENPETGYVVVGAYDDRQVDRVVHSEQFSLLGNVQQAYADIESGKIETVFVTLPMTANSRIEEILRVLGDTKAQVHLVPNFFVYNSLGRHSTIFES